jgi:predicted SnoaL-like aldol condensation-catalyzing enzyme
MNLDNKQRVEALLNSIESGDPAPVGYINPENYTQHNLSVADGLAGFGEVLQLLPEGSVEVDVLRLFQDGDYVVAHSKYEFFGPKAGFDIFRFEDGLIVEHWDNLQQTETPNDSGRTQFDGATSVVDLEKTEANKAIVQSLMNDVFLGANPQKITEYISTETYIQHNPAVGDGVAALGQALEAMANAGTPMIYAKNHIILGEGNFVLAVSEGQFLGESASFYDLFRIEDGLVVEHWDTIEKIPARDQWKNDNGKFGFPIK